MALTPSSSPRSVTPHQHKHDASGLHHVHGHHDHHHIAPAAIAIPFSFFRASALHLAGLAALISATLWLILIWAMQ
jgi:hypothetical protein